MEPVTERKRHRDFALRKLHTIVSTFMQLADTENKEHLRMLIAVGGHLSHGISSIFVQKFLGCDN